MRGLTGYGGPRAYTTFWACPSSRDEALYGRVGTRPHGDLIGAFAMRLLAYYIVFVLVGMVMAYLIGRAVEQWSAGASLPVFLACFFFVFWAAWRLAVRVT